MSGPARDGNLKPGPDTNTFRHPRSSDGKCEGEVVPKAKGDSCAVCFAMLILRGRNRVAYQNHWRLLR
jgi:hypothetical protein